MATKMSKITSFGLNSLSKFVLRIAIRPIGLRSISRCSSAFSTRSENGNSLGKEPVNDILEDSEFLQLARLFFSIPGSGHRVFMVHPLEKVHYKRSEDDKKRLQLQLDEAVTLVETLHNWKVVSKFTLNTKNSDQKQVFGSGNVERLKNLVQSSAGSSAVFVNVDRLTGLQLTELESVLNLPVFDRYGVVLQIFNCHARTKVAKLQVALAEIPYFRVRMRIENVGSGERQGRSLGHIGGAGETYMEFRKRLLQVRESKIKDAIKNITAHRDVTNKKREKKKLPTVAVVGYTNAGKTSLIKALTGDKDMQPLNQLFATLDVTAHGGILPNRMPVVYVDTVGFISNIPTMLIQAFMATLDDVRKADVIIHIRDISHPDNVAQKECVLATLKDIYGDDEVLNNIIEVGNKVDLISKQDVDDLEGKERIICVSSTQKTGLKELLVKLERQLMITTKHGTKTFRVESGGEAAQWLYKEGSVTNVACDEVDNQFLLMDVVMNEANLSRFRHYFGECEISL